MGLTMTDRHALKLHIFIDALVSFIVGDIDYIIMLQAF